MAVLPLGTTENNNNESVITAATEVINGVTYEVVYLDGDYYSNKAKLAPEESSGNYRYVMTADFDMSFDATHHDCRFWIGGNAVIWDLNGHTLTTNGWVSGGNVEMDYWSYLCLRCTRFELTDSSAAQSGRLVGQGRWQNIVMLECEDLVISGGGGLLAVSYSGTHDSASITFTGGVYDTLRFWGLNADENLVVAPYLNATYDADGRPTAVKPYDDYAVSTTDLAAGAYNYVYGYAWELNLTELNNLAISTDKTYYLWARDKDGWYHYLDLCYTDGKWK